MSHRSVEIRSEGGPESDSEGITCNVSVNIGAVPVNGDLEEARDVAVSLVSTIREVLIEELQSRYDGSDLNGSVISVSFSAQASDGANLTENRPILL